MSAFLTALRLRALSAEECRRAGSPDVGLFELSEDFGYDSELLGPLVVRAGFITDFASIPKPALWYVDGDDPCIAFGSVIHDYLYSCSGITPSGNFTRQQADALLREAMLICGASTLQAATVYAAVRFGGASHWKETKVVKPAPASP